MNLPLAAPRSAHDDDAALARCIAGGDVGAFQQLMRRYNRRLYRIARATLGIDADAEDALQEAYLLAFRKIDQYRGDASLGTWLTRLVLNECMGRLRRAARRDNVVPMVAPPPDRELDDMAMSTTDSPDAPDRLADRARLREVLQRQLDQLPRAFRIVFVLRAVEELSVEETAAALGLPEATVRSRHFRARGLLREALAREIDLAEGDIFAFGGAHCEAIVSRVLERLARE